MKSTPLVKVNSISEFHKFRGLKPPLHPLVSLIDYSTVKYFPEYNHVSWLLGYFSISIKKDVPGKYRYGQMEYDFDEGVMSFFAPNQILNVAYLESDPNKKPSGWILLIHPDFIWNTPLAKRIKEYSFFEYAVTESLFLSEKEEQIMEQLMLNIQMEYQASIDQFSQGIIISQIELLLNYAERFYERQFLTRRKQNHSLLTRLEDVLNEYFKRDSLRNQGLPTVQFVANELNVTPNYLSNCLKSLTGLSTQNHIHEKLIAIAKEKLSASDLSVGEIAYELGFEHSQSFSKLFKNKTNLSPLDFRASFN